MKSEDIIKVENKKRKEEFVIRWNLTYLCNYYCDFCIQGNRQKHLEKSKGESTEIRKAICRNLIRFIETELNGKYDQIHLFLIGGEITILQDFIAIMTSIVNCQFDGRIVINITTNLSTSKEVLEQLVSLFAQKTKHMRDLHIVASFYPTFAKEEEFVEKIKILTQNNKISKWMNFRIIYKKVKKIFQKYKKSKVIANIDQHLGKIYVSVGYPICKDEEYDEYLQFKRRYQRIIGDINFIVIKAYQTSISEKLKKRIVKENEQEKNIKVTFQNGKIYYCSNNNKISLLLEGEEAFHSKGYWCDIGMNSISISNLGEVSRCTSCKKETVIGNMQEGNVTIPTNKIRCPAEKCNCSYYGVIEKEREKV